MRRVTWFVIAVAAVLAAVSLRPGTPSAQTSTAPAAEPNREANALLTRTIAGRRPGRALDLGLGNGRNAVMLAGRGWSVTGVDLSPAAVALARKNAAARNVSLETVVSDLEVYEFGNEKWDLISSIYMHGWHDRSKTDVAARLYDALAPGGLLVIEGLAKPEVVYGLDADALRMTFARFRILRWEDVYSASDWDDDDRVRHLVRVVAQKPLVTPPLARIKGSRVQRFRGSLGSGLRVRTMNQMNP